MEVLNIDEMVAVPVGTAHCRSLKPEESNTKAQPHMEARWRVRSAVALRSDRNYSIAQLQSGVLLDCRGVLAHELPLTVGKRMWLSGGTPPAPIP